MFRIDFGAHLLPAIVLGAALTFFSVGYAYSASPAPQRASTVQEHTLANATETHIPIRLRPGKPQLVQLDVPVSKVVVDSNTDHLTAMVYSEKSIALVPGKPGGAHITAKDKDGKLIMARYVIVADPGQKYIRIRRTCKDANDIACKSTRLYYCPNYCYETHVMGQTANAAPKKD